MRPGMLLCVTIVAIALPGCATDKPVTSLSFFGKARSLPTAITGQDVIQFELALIERPLYDKFVNNELWLLADEQIVPLEQKAYLDDSGFRVGLVNGLNPSGLQTLLTSNRSCQLPWRQYTRAGNAALYPLGPTIAHCKLDRPGTGETLTFEQATCFMQITPTLAPGNKVTLHCVPRIRHGESEMVARQTSDGSAPLLVQEFPFKEFDDLAFDVTMEINQYLVIGARANRVDQLGWRCFWGGDESVPVQRLLAIRTCRPAATENTDEPADADPHTPHVPSVAQLASQTGTR